MSRCAFLLNTECVLHTSKNHVIQLNVYPRYTMHIRKLWCAHSSNSCIQALSRNRRMNPDHNTFVKNRHIKIFAMYGVPFIRVISLS